MKYAVTFTSSATGALAAQTGQVVLRAPLGTTFQTSGVRFVDLSSNASGSGYPNTLSDGGRTLTATVPFDVPAGRQLRVEAVATNTSTVGSQQLEVSTSSDPSIATAGFTLVAASPVSGASVSLTSLAAGASQVKYAVTFTSSATGALAAQTGQVVLRAPLGTTFQTSGVRFVDLSSNASGSGYPNTLSDGGRTLTATVPFDVPAGRQLRVEAVATNTSTVGSQQLEVSTSSDPSIATAGFTLVAASPVSGASVSLTSLAAGASQVKYAVTFTSSATGALAAQTGQVVLRAPLGTTFQTSGVRFVDLSSNASGSGYPNTLSDGGRTLTATVPFDVPAGRQLRVEAVATNTSTVGSQQLEVSTSSDPSIATAGFTLVAASPVSGASVSLTSLAAGASQVKYAVTFTSSATGALAAQTGQVVLRAPLGTTFQTSGVRFVDLSSNASGSGYPNTLSDGGRTLTATVPFDVPAGRQLRVEAVATNTSTVGSQQLEVSTSSDPSIATAGFTLVAASPVSGASVSLTSLAAGASQVKYAVTFTSSATGALAAQTGQVVLRAPLGTTFQTSGVRFVDLSSNASGSGYPNTLSDGGRTLTATVPFDVPAGRQLRVEAVATNTSTVGSQQLEVSTSSDPSIATAGFTLVAASPVSGGTLTLSQARAGALRTDYTIAFRTTAQGRVIGDGQIKLEAPADAVLPSVSSAYCLRKLSLGTSSCTLLAVDAAAPNRVMLRSLGGDLLSADSDYQLLVHEVINPLSAGEKTFTFRTTSDITDASLPFAIAPFTGARITGVVRYKGNPVPGARVEACAGEECVTDVSGSQGQYELLPAGNAAYQVVATPPTSGTARVAGRTATTLSVGATALTQDLALTEPVPLPEGTSLQTGGTGTTTTSGVPRVTSGETSVYRTSGPPNSYGLVTIHGISRRTGLPAAKLVAMRESPTGSGNYAANLPPFGAYFKGVARVRTRFFAVTARTVDVTAGPVSGGTPVMFHLSSPLSISSAAFGDRAGSGLTKLNDQTYVVKTPPGVGTVDIAARTPSGARIPLGTFTYLGLERDPSSPDHGGVHGGNQVCVTGQNLGTRPIIAFDGVPAALPVRGADGRYCVKAPPGRGKVHVTAIASGGQSASFAYTYDGVMSDADYANEIAGHFLDLGLEGFEYGSLMNDAWEAFNLEGNGAGLAVFAARELVTRAGWWDLTGGPLDVPLDFATPLLFAGPEGVIAYLALTYAADKLNEAFEEACSDKLLEPVEQCIGAMFDVLIDPAGTIVDRSGRPVAGATATLTERTGPGSTFVPVPTDSGRISPNVNPQTAPSDGSFKWDAAAGTYRVEASSDQCTLPGGLPATAHTADLVLPPPVTGLVLVLPCDLSSPAPPSVDDVSPTLVEQSDGGDVLVSGSRLGAVDEVTVGGEEVSFMVLASGAIRAHVPANLQSGLEPVVASGPAGASSVTSASQIRVVATGPKNTGAPAVRFSALPPDDVPSDVATFAFEASDPDEPAGSLRLTCFIDGRLLDPCVSPVRLEGLAAGEHRFSVTATDSGNLSSDPVAHHWTISGRNSVADPRSPKPAEPASLSALRIVSARFVKRRDAVFVETRIRVPRPGALRQTIRLMSGQRGPACSSAARVTRARTVRLECRLNRRARAALRRAALQLRVTASLTSAGATVQRSTASLRVRRIR